VDPSEIGLLGEGVVRRHPRQLCAGEDHDLGPHAQVFGDRALERRRDHRGIGFLAGEDHVAALDIGRYVGVAKTQHS
jgi:hypothetical protein